MEAVMNEYNFWAIQNIDGGRIRDRYRLFAYSYEQACEDAQALEYREAEELERDPVIYDEFVEVTNG
jgi:hypothetical protein